MRQFKLGFGVACCVAAVALLGGCAKEKDCCGSCGDKSVSASMVGEKKACSSECAKKCNGGEVSPGMVSEKKSCASECAKKCNGSGEVSPSMVSEKKDCAKSCGAKKACSEQNAQ